MPKANIPAIIVMSALTLIGCTILCAGIISASETTMGIGITWMCTVILFGWILYGLLDDCESFTKLIPRDKIELVKAGLLLGDKIIVSDYASVQAYMDDENAFILETTKYNMYGFPTYEEPAYEVKTQSK